MAAAMVLPPPVFKSSSSPRSLHTEREGKGVSSVEGNTEAVSCMVEAGPTCLLTSRGREEHAGMSARSWPRCIEAQDAIQCDFSRDVRI